MLVAFRRGFWILGLWSLLTGNFAPVAAQTPSDSLRIPQKLYLQVERYLTVWDSLSQVKEVALPESGAVTIPRRQFEIIYPDIATNLLRYQTFQMKKILDLTQTIQALVRVRFPDSTLSVCRLLQPPTDSCLTVPRRVWQKNVGELEILQQIFAASTRDSTLEWQTTGTPTVTTNFWGKPFVHLSGRLIFLSSERDTLYTLEIHKLKVAARVKKNFWQVHLTVNWHWSGLGKSLASSWAVGASSANYRRFFGEIFLGPKGGGAGFGWRLFENAGPVLGVQASFAGAWFPTAGFAFFLN